ncbi:hypothetical protein [Gemmata sp.]|uniref:hypothetical protein n=1 Tax=Gemmata sp. TaxID=1914242 RepID=UPI003F6EEE06
MDAPSDVGTPGPVEHRAGSPRTEVLLEALKAAITTPGEHRLFRSGKLSGLFPTRAGTSAEAALVAVQEGLLETVRTETRGKIVTEWVRGTPKAVAFVHDHDSPKSVLRELKETLATARGGVPVWMAEAKAEVALLSARFEERAAAMLTRLDELATRVEAALRRAETSGPVVGEQVGRLVPWAVEALEYLDRRRASGAGGDCTLPELFHAVRVKCPELLLPAFHDGLKRLHDVRAVRLLPAIEMSEPEYAIVVEGKLVYAATR